MQPTSEQFTEKAWSAITFAQGLAKDYKQQQVETEHLLLALIKEEGLTKRILEKVSIQYISINDI